MNGLNGISNFNQLLGNVSSSEEESSVSDGSMGLVKGLFDKQIADATKKMMLKNTSDKTDIGEDLSHYIDLIKKKLPIDSDAVKKLSKQLYANAKEALLDLYSPQKIIDQKRYITLSQNVQSLISLVQDYGSEISVSWLSSLNQDMKKDNPLKKILDERFKKWSSGESLELNVLKKQENLLEDEHKECILSLKNKVLYCLSESKTNSYSLKEKNIG